MDSKKQKTYTARGLFFVIGALILSPTLATYGYLSLGHTEVLEGGLRTILLFLQTEANLRLIYSLSILVFVICLYFIYSDYERFLAYRNSRQDEEYGSAKWMTKKDMPKFNQEFFYDPEIVKKHSPHVREKWNQLELKKTNSNSFDYSKAKVGWKKDVYDECFQASQILAQDVYISMNCKFINRNIHTLTIGSSGQGKSYSELFPNALNANSNYVFCDPSGEIYRKIGRFLRDQCGYELKVFNVKDFRLSMRYNPLAYIETEKDINVLVDAILANINEGEKKKAGDFFDQGAKGLLSAVISLLRELYADQPEKINFMNVMELLRMARQHVDENGNVSSELVKIIDRVEEINPRSYARRLYRNFEVGGPKVCNEIIISATTMLGAYFDMVEMNNLTMYDELDLGDLATEKKCALFLTIPQTTSTYNFMSAMCYSQLFELITKYGERYAMERGEPDNPAVPRHISFWLDEFANCATRSTVNAVGITDKAVA